MEFNEKQIEGINNGVKELQKCMLKVENASKDLNDKHNSLKSICQVTGGTPQSTIDACLMILGQFYLKKLNE